MKGLDALYRNMTIFNNLAVDKISNNGVFAYFFVIDCRMLIDVSGESA